MSSKNVITKGLGILHNGRTRIKMIVMGTIICTSILSTQASASEQVTGGWSIPAETTITTEIQSVFDRAVETISDTDYYPIALLATQVVAGRNYCVMCRAISATSDVPYYVIMYIYEDLQGDAKVLQVNDVSIGLEAVTQPENEDIVTFENFAEKLEEIGIHTEYVGVAADMIGALDGYKLKTEGNKTETNGSTYVTKPIACELYKFDQVSDTYKKLEDTGVIDFAGFQIEMLAHNGYGLIIEEDFPDYNDVVDLFNRIQ